MRASRPSSHLTFSSFFLPPPILAGLSSLHLSHPSSIQLHAIPPAQHGLDVIAQAQSGTGKTAIYAIAALTAVLRGRAAASASAASSPSASGITVLVLVPTRELAVQVERVLRSIGRDVSGLRVESVMGGKGGVWEDRARLRGCDCLIATVGRLRQLLDEGVLKTEMLKLLVLDEADALLSPSSSWCADVEAIIASLPAHPQRQTLLFSATWPLSLMDRAKAVTHEAQIIMLDSQRPHDSIKHYVIYTQQQSSDAQLGTVAAAGSSSFTSSLTTRLPPSLASTSSSSADAAYDAKVSLLLLILASFPFHQCLVFTRSASHTAQLHSSLTLHGYPALQLSASLPPAVRTAAMESFSSLRTRILVTSDVLSRGFDQRTVNLVVHFHAAYDVAAYLHRCGRSGRWGMRGRSVWLAERTEMEAAMLTALQQQAGVVVQELQVVEAKGGRRLRAVRGDAAADAEEDRLYRAEMRHQSHQLRHDGSSSGWQLDKFHSARQVAMREMDDDERREEAAPPQAEEEEEEDEDESSEESDPTVMPPLIIPFSPFSLLCSERQASALFPPRYPAMLDVVHLQSRAVQTASLFHRQLHTAAQ